MRIRESAEVKNKLGIAGNIKVGINTAYSGLVELCGAIDIEVIIGFGGRDKLGDFVGCWHKIAWFFIVK